MVVHRVHRRRFHLALWPSRPRSSSFNSIAQRRVHALPHLRMRRNHRDALVCPDAHERIHRKCFSLRGQRRSRFARQRHIQTHQQSAAKRRSRAKKLPPPTIEAAAIDPTHEFRPSRSQNRSPSARSAARLDLRPTAARFSAPRHRPRDESPANPRISSAAANIPAHRLVNIVIRGLRILRQQHRRAHDLSRLAISALRHVHFNPSLSAADASSCRRALRWWSPASLRARHRRHAGTNRLPIQMHRARPAQRHPAAKFRAGHRQSESRKTHSSGVDGSTSTCTDFPFTKKLVIIFSPCEPSLSPRFPRRVSSPHPPPAFKRCPLYPPAFYRRCSTAAGWMVQAFSRFRPPRKRIPQIRNLRRRRLRRFLCSGGRSPPPGVALAFIFCFSPQARRPASSKAHRTGCPMRRNRAWGFSAPHSVSPRCFALPFFLTLSSRTRFSREGSAFSPLLAVAVSPISNPKSPRP